MVGINQTIWVDLCNLLFYIACLGNLPSALLFFSSLFLLPLPLPFVCLSLLLLAPVLAMALVLELAPKFVADAF
jgi:hypothetical protein